MLDRNLKPSIPPSRRDVVITLLATSNPESRLIQKESLEMILSGLAKAGQAGAEDFGIGNARSKVLETLAHLASNGLTDENGLTVEGLEYASLVDPATQFFVGGFIAGAEHMDQRRGEC